MERYFAINTKHLWAPHEVNINSEELQYWILYQTCKEGGKSIRMQTSKGARYKLNQVVPGSLHCILFEEGEEYFFEHLEEEEANGKIDIDQLLVKKGFASEIKEQEKIADMGPIQINVPKTVRENEICRITVNENGFLICSPLKSKKYAINGVVFDEKSVKIQVCYKPDTKKLDARIINSISSHLRVTEKNSNYEEVFSKMLEEAQLDKDGSMQLYDKLEEYSWKYMIDGGDTFVEKIEGAESRVFYDKGFQKIQGRTPSDMFAHWISEKWERTLDKAKIMNIWSVEYRIR